MNQARSRRGPWYEALRTATFRTTVVVSLVFATAILLLYGFIFWQTAGYERTRIDGFLLHESAALAAESPDDLAHDVEVRFAGDLHRLTFAALFDSDFTRMAGDISRYPMGLPPDGQVRRIRVERPTRNGPRAEIARVLALRLRDGRILAVGRSDADLAKLRALVGRGFLLGLGPAMLFALVAGMVASVRMLVRIADLNQTIERIMAGAIEVRLPVHHSRDAVDRLAVSVNRMLDRIGMLIREVQGVGDDIAHDLRTPLSRARSRLEGGRSRAQSLDELGLVVDRAIGDLDQTFATITALLRIRQIETGNRRENFGAVHLGAILKEAQDLYQPLAELRAQTVEAIETQRIVVHGDRDLLFEAVANLLDNAVKFTPDGGSIQLSAFRRDDGTPVLQVVDDGPGIASAERELVLRRFYRSDRSRHDGGTGLGLSLVAAIVRLHDFELEMRDTEQGFAIDIVCRG